MRLQTILHPTDFSAHSECAFRLACSLARDYGARLIVLHVAQLPVMAQDGMVLLPPQPEAYREAVAEQLRQLRAPNSGVRIAHRLEEGDTSTEILRVAQETSCDLLVLGTHGRTGLSRLLMGSVAEKVLRRAPCPVLTAKVPLPETQPTSAGNLDKAMASG
jgi:nucleotide-binding universal stress UspA family protein